MSLVGGAPAVKLGRCNPYGAETGGPKRVLGGLYGAGSAATPGMGLPDNVAQGEWPCDQPAQVRCRMVCDCGHRGRVMELCSWHDVQGGHSEIVAGTIRWVSETTRAHGHFEEIQKRQSDTCTACMFPPWAAELAKAIQAWQAELGALYDMRRWGSPEARQIMAKVEQAGIQLSEGTTQLPVKGKIHKCKLTLVPVS